MSIHEVIRLISFFAALGCLFAMCEFGFKQKPNFEATGWAAVGFFVLSLIALAK